MTKLHEICTKRKKHGSLKLVLEPDGLITWQGVNKAACQVTVGGNVAYVDVSITITVVNVHGFKNNFSE